MQIPDWSTVVAAVIAFFTGATWLGRQHQRLNAHDVEFKDVKAGMETLNTKMGEHTTQSANQYAQIQRALGRLEGHFGTNPVEKSDDEQ